MKPQSRLEPYKNLQHVPKAVSKVVTNVSYVQPRDHKNLGNLGYNLHKRNNSEAQASRNQNFMGQKRASEHFVDISQQYMQHLQRQIGDLSNRSPLPSARGATPTMQNSRDNSMNQKAGVMNSDLQNKKVSRSTLESRQSPKPSKKTEAQHRKNPSVDFKAQDVTRLQKKNGNDLPSYFKLGMVGNYNAKNSVTAAKKLYSNNMSPGRGSQQPKTPPPKIKMERPTTASSRTTTNSKGGVTQNHNDISYHQSDSIRPSSLRLQQEGSSSYRENKNTEAGASGSLPSYRRSKEDIHASDPKSTPKNYHENKKGTTPIIDKKKDSRPATGDSYIIDYINRFDLYSKRVSKERVILDKSANDSKKPPYSHVGSAMVQESNGAFAKIYNNNPTLQSVLNKVSKYMGKPPSDNAEPQPKKTMESKLANNQSQQQRFPSRQNSLAQVVEANNSGLKNSRKATEVEVWAQLGSRKSSYGNINKGKSSPVGSKDASPRDLAQKGRATSMSINELKDLLRANKKLVEMIEPDAKFLMNQSLANEERRFRKQSISNEQDFEMVEESLKVYKNLRDEAASYSKDLKSDHKMHSASTEDDSKNSNSAFNKRPFSNITEVNKIPRPSSHLQHSPNTQVSRPSTNKYEDESDDKQGKSSHKKGSRSVNIANAVDQMINGAQLPINLNSMRKERLFTPEISENVSANTSLINEYQAIRIRDTNKGDSRSTTPTSKNGKQNRIENPKDAQNMPFNYNNFQPNVTPQSSEKKIKIDESDDQNLREGLTKLLHHSFKSKGICPPTSLDYYRLVKMIGKGAFGKVYLGIHLLTGESVALKSIEKQYMKDEASKRKIFQEVLILKRCSHRNIIRLLEVFENKKYLFIVQEYASQGDLLGHVKDNGKLAESEAKGIFKQIVHGVQHCHQQGILHRDIKLDNILLDKNMVVKICDFGVSRFVKKGQLINEQCGTPAYIAPEIIQEKGYEGCYADLWSMGVLLYAMITGTVPFRANNLEDLHYAIIEGTYSCPSYLSEEAKDLIGKLLKVDPYVRININEVDKHPWFNPNRLEDGRSKSIVGKTKSTSMEYKLDNKRQTVPDVGVVNIEEVLKGQTSKIMDQTILKIVETLGYPRDFIIHSVQNNSCNHASACFFLLAKKLQLLS